MPNEVDALERRLTRIEQQLDGLPVRQTLDGGRAMLFWANLTEALVSGETADATVFSPVTDTETTRTISVEDAAPWIPAGKQLQNGAAIVAQRIGVNYFLLVGSCDDLETEGA